MHKELHYRLLALLMTVVTIFQFVIISPNAVFAEVTEANESAEEIITETGNGETPVLRATAIPQPTSSAVLCFTSDTHNMSNNTAANRLGSWLDKVSAKHGGVSLMAFGGDMANAGAGQSDYWTFTKADMQQLDDRNVTGVYTTGNHEHSPGRYSSSSTDTAQQKFKISSAGADGAYYRVYCLGSQSSSSSYTNQVDSLKSYLSSVDNTRPIFIITHFPLHYYNGRTTTDAKKIIDALNDAVTQNGQTIVFLWGHNHTMSDTYYDQIYGPGGVDSIQYSSSSSNTATIKFYYGGAGCMSDSEYGGGSASVKGKGLAVVITPNRGSGTMEFHYYDENLNDVTESNSIKSVSVTLGDPIAVTGVTISPASVSVKERETVQLTATVSPSDASNKAVTWSSNNTGVATVSETGLVRGVKEGTATITVTTVDGSYTASRTVNVTYNDNPSVEETIDITPSTSNPEQSLSINVGDTLVINVENGSSNSAYDFTATLSNSSAAKINGNATVNIAAGAKGQITVEGIADGTVDITIQNNSSYGSQYVRKGIIHLTVGAGGTTPVDPPTGDTVSVTPTTDNPEESIRISVGDTLTVKVTNGSTNSAYDYSITLSNSSVAKVNGNSTVNIAAGATGQFTVEGIADGNVDITIKNNQSSSSYVRKATIHLTVGAGGTTPVGDTVNITPSTDNPEESIRINVNDTLTVNVTNGSSNSAYDFTATLSNSGIAQIQGNSTVNIAAGAIGQFVVKGLSEGTVEITIQNENSYGSQYVRKGVIHLTVGSGTTPVDPPSGDTVTYRLATTMEAGKEYIIANGNSGSVYVLSNESGGSKQLKGISATVSDSTITLSAANAAKAVFSVTANSNSSQSGMWLTNGSQYLYADSSDGLRLVASSTQTSSSNSAKSWHYRSDRNLLWFFKDTSSSNGYTDTSQTYKYFLKVSSGNFTDDHVSTTSLENSTIPAMYLYAKDDTPANVSGVNLDKTSLNMKVGRTATLTATVLPGNAQNKNVTWTSSNPAAATVNNGVVTAVAVGSTVITVTTEEGGFTATCQVTVSNASGTTYVLTDKLEDGKNYLIANGNTGSVYILSNEAGGSRELKGVSVEVVGDTITIDDDDISKVTFSSVKNNNSSQSGVWLMNGSQYLYADSSDGLRLVASSTQTSSSNNAKSWHYKADNKNILWFFKDTSSSDGYTDTSQTYKYFLKVSSGNFTDDHVSTTSLGNTTTPVMYLFVEDNGTAPHTHTYGQPTWNWAADHKSATATFTCTAGDDTQTVTDNAPAEAVVSAATCTADKVVKYTATVTLNGTQYTATSENVTVEGTATGHTYGQPTWSWADDYKSATATFTCTSGDDTKTVKDNAPVETIVSAATCTADKVAKYTAKVTFNGTEYTVTADNVAVPNTATGHNWGRPTYTWANDYSSVTASCTCRNDSSHVETETVATVTEITTAATCTTKGETTYTANFSSSAFTTQTMTIDDVPALGHDYVWRVTKEATCTAKGQETGTCSRCGDEQTREI